MIIIAEVMKNILDNVPGDYELEFYEDGISYPISDKVEIDVSGKRIILKSN